MKKINHKTKLIYIAIILCFLYPKHNFGNTISLHIDSNFYSQTKIQWAFPKFNCFNQNLQFKTSYSTSRIQAQLNNSLKIDHFIFTVAWITNTINFKIPFTKIKTQFNPYLQCSAGQKTYEIENHLFDLLDNATYTLALFLGSKLNLKDHHFGLETEIGYNFIQSSIVNPISITIGVWLNV